jgi:hypothetical protein
MTTAPGRSSRLEWCAVLLGPACLSVMILMEFLAPRGIGGLLGAFTGLAVILLIHIVSPAILVVNAVRRRRSGKPISKLAIGGISYYGLVFVAVPLVTGPRFFTGSLVQHVGNDALEERPQDAENQVSDCSYGDSTRPYDICFLSDPRKMFVGHLRYNAVLVLPQEQERPAVLYTPTSSTERLLLSGSTGDRVRECVSREGYPVHRVQGPSGGPFSPLNVGVSSPKIDASIRGTAWMGQNLSTLRARADRFNPEWNEAKWLTRHVLVGIILDGDGKYRRVARADWLRAEKRWEWRQERAVVDCTADDPVPALVRPLLYLGCVVTVPLDILTFPIQLLILLIPFGGK